MTEITKTGELLYQACMFESSYKVGEMKGLKEGRKEGMEAGKKERIEIGIKEGKKDKKSNTLRLNPGNGKPCAGRTERGLSFFPFYGI